MKRLKKVIYIIIFVLFFIFTYLNVGYRLYTKYEEKINTQIEVVDNVKMYRTRDKDYYIITGDYKGEYDFQEFTYPNSINNNHEFSGFVILDYYEYLNYCYNNDITLKYNDKNSNYLLYSDFFYFQSNVKVRVANLVLEGNKATLYAMDGSIWYNKTIDYYNDSAVIYIFPIPTNITEKELISLAPGEMTLDEIRMRELVRNSTGVN